MELIILWLLAVVGVLTCIVFIVNTIKSIQRYFKILDSDIESLKTSIKYSDRNDQRLNERLNEIGRAIHKNEDLQENVNIRNEIK